jgi:hypothetical protein
MSVKVATNRFIVSSVGEWGRLYQDLVSNFAGFQRLGAQLIGEAQKAQALRQISKLEEIGAILSHFPIQEYRLIGQYHLGWCAYRKGKDARAIFENIVENSATYRSMALIDLATLELNAGNCDLGIKFCTEAIRQSHNISTILNASRSIAVIQSVEGFHPQAVKGLEAIAPLIRYATPIARHQYFNSLAVEYREVGRIQAAQSLCRVVLASPFISSYPEWQQTAEDLRGANRSFVVIDPSPAKIGKLLRMPETAPVVPVKQDRPAPVVSLQDWKKKMVKEPNGDQKDKRPSKDKSERELFFELTEIISKHQFDADQLQKLIDFAERLSSKPDSDPNKD